MGRDPRPMLGWRLEGKLDAKDGPLPGPAGHRDRAAHRHRQSLRDHQAETAAAEQPRSIRLGLGERTEQPLQRRRRDADAGILHLDRQPKTAGRRSTGCDPQQDVAGRRELERIADQVEQHLAQPSGVDADLPRGAVLQLAAKLDLSGAGARLDLQAQTGRGTRPDRRRPVPAPAGPRRPGSRSSTSLMTVSSASADSIALST